MSTTKKGSVKSVTQLAASRREVRSPQVVSASPRTEAHTDATPLYIRYSDALREALRLNDHYWNELPVPAKELLAKHFLPHLANKDKWSDAGLFFVHHRITDPKTQKYFPFGGVTLCYKFEDIDEVGKVKIKVAVAVCSLSDGYNKQSGRSISAGRMISSDVGRCTEYLRFQNGFTCPVIEVHVMAADENISSFLTQWADELLENIYSEEDEDVVIDADEDDGDDVDVDMDESKVH